ncbi:MULTISPECIES: FliA/WhiG family RNA polymerase sigma factor [unclassified Paenibacillus]|uniref:FliA/WhiG family RNA polymerase sigma factor n=1 Tax=Paenibacillus provencensis TaxID=441151 RepID=A0ABW3PSK3_9BACL|nr:MULTISPECIES: FliA/WhiG family RNA polymerase sigma factor [unclassified Paenibacillus]MCM3128739.1 FliA/WhiG family RNA polymerase sigma factor [Paenibacillus sp. MER 78]SFS48220.1 RNA polymerase sigma factor for flagellar operon FliA [Paenibacillus sp. 453mf]
MTGRNSSHLADMDLWERWKEQGDLDARNQLIEKHLHIVQYVSSRLAVGLPKNVSKDDLESNGALGLMDALDKFDYKRGLQFETYASWRVRGAILDGLRQGDWVPRSVREKAKKIEEAYQHLEQRYSRSVTDEEMGQYLDVSAGDFRNMLQEVAVMSLYSLEDPLREEDAETRMSLLIDEKAYAPEQTVRDIHLKQALMQGIDKLTEKERIVVSLLYYEDLSLSEIAEVMSLSPSRISQLHSKAILRLRGTLEKQRELLMNRH